MRGVYVGVVQWITQGVAMKMAGNVIQWITLKLSQKEGTDMSMEADWDDYSSEDDDRPIDERESQHLADFPRPALLDLLARCRLMMEIVRQHVVFHHGERCSPLAGSLTRLEKEATLLVEFGDLLQKVKRREILTALAGIHAMLRYSVEFSLPEDGFPGREHTNRARLLEAVFQALRDAEGLFQKK